MFAIQASIGMAIVYGFKVCMSVAIVGMVNHTAVALEGQSHSLPSTGCANIDAETAGEIKKKEDGPYDWDSNKQALILSSYFWGYLVSNLPGGQLSETFSAKWVMFFSVAINVVCSMMMPALANMTWVLVIVMRVLQGVGGGVSFPACHVLLSKWSPPNERSIMSSIAYAGTSLGTVLSLLGSGLIAELLGWEAIFYIFGGLSCIWLLIWTLFIFDSPVKQPFITQKERDNIIESLGIEDHDKTYSTPWKSIMTSVPVWAIIITHTCTIWGWYLLLIELPLYMQQILRFPLSENSVRVAIPYFSLWIFTMVLSKVLDILRHKEMLSTTAARKIATSICNVVPALCLIGIYFNGCDRNIVTVFITIGITALGAMFSGFLSNHIDIAPNFAGTLMALSNTPATISGIVAPIFIGYLTHDKPTVDSWNVAFLVTIIVFIISWIVYTIFGTGEEQPWNKPE